MLNKIKKYRIAIIILAMIVLGGFYVFLKKSHSELDISSISSNSEGLEEIIDWYYKEYDVPAISVAIVKNTSEVEYINRGVLNRDFNTEVDQKTLYQIASLTKTFTGIIAKSLSIEGKIDLNESVVSYLPEGLSKKSKSKFEKVIIYDLLFHSSGLPRRANSLNRRMLGGPIKSPYSENDLIKDLTNPEFLFEPGQGWSYSNLGYALLGYILEKITSDKYESLVSKYISQEYNLSETKLTLDNSDRKFLAIPYRPEWNTIETSDSDFGLHSSASGIYSNINDLSKLMKLQVKAYASFDSLKVKSPIILTDKVLGTGPVAYGLGTFRNLIVKEKDTIVSIGHGGDADGYASSYSFIPEKKLGLIILTSSGGDWIWKMEKQLTSKLLDDSEL